MSVNNMSEYRHFEQLFETFRYPAGESHLRLRDDISIEGVAVIEARVRNFEELGQLLTADRLLSRRRHPVQWFVPYFPFARHDRRIDERDGLELEVALDLVRDLDLTIVDPHSDVAGLLAHIPQSVVVEQFRQAGAFGLDPTVIIPDAGALKKAQTWLGTRDVIQGKKQRDPRSGRLSGFEIDAASLNGRPCLIVDDICDGGGTFIGLAEQLKTRGAGPLILAVTHGLFTRGVGRLTDHFEKIYTFGPEAEVNGAVTIIAYGELFAKGQVL